uniref:polo kinase n=1 Tax=Glossina morsitans morsitans TaxID=37546 RepID=A0A1B0G629_GLOMM
MSPRLETGNTSAHEVDKQRKPLVEINAIRNDDTYESTFLKNNLQDRITASGSAYEYNENYHSDIESLTQQLTKLIEAKPLILPGNLSDENTDPAAQPLFWISKWVDYTDKYGFGYQLCDDGMGVMFNDATTLILLPNGINVHYIDKDEKETYMTNKKYCGSLEKKIKLLSYFKRYMNQNLAKAGANNINLEGDQISRMPHLRSWFRTNCALIMQLTNGTIQLNFADHIKIILCPRMSAVTYMDQKNTLRTYLFATIIKHGCSKDLHQRIRYAHILSAITPTVDFYYNNQ